MHAARSSIALAATALLLGACTGSDRTQRTGAAPSTTGSSSAARPSVTATSSGSGRTVASSGSSAAPKPLSTMIRQGAHATYPVRVWAQESSADCAAHAYGPDVPGYLRAHACRRVVRYLATTTANGRAVGISGSTVTFGGAVATAGQSAAGFAALVTDPAKGGIDDLFRDGRRLPGGPAGLPAAHASNARNDAATVAVVDAWYLSGRTRDSDPALSELLEAVT